MSISPLSGQPPQAAEEQELPRLPLFMSAVEALGGGALVLDHALRVAGITQVAERLLGARVPIGAHAVKVLCGDDVDRPIAEALAAGRPVTGTVRRLRPDATPQLVLVRARPLRAAGHRIGWLLVLTEEPARPDDLPIRFHGMWTRDVTVKRLFHLAERVAHSDASVLIQGEMGTGKASLAAAIHALSPRHAGPFSTVNCAGALVDRHVSGQARDADGGTLFLDDVTQLPLDVQAELLRILESGVATPEGSSQSVPADVRVIATTSTSLQQEVLRGRFRADLMYRLRIVSLHLPPLRARPGDVPLLADKFIAELNARGARRVERIAPDALARLTQHDWPGNVRELRTAIESALATGEGPELLASDLPSDVAEPLAGTEVLLPPPSSPPPSGLDDLDEAARIRRALERASGDRAQAALMLGMSRTTLWRRMRALGLIERGTGE